MLHKYTAKDISGCLQSRRIVLVGDSTIRQIFWAIGKKLDPKGANEDLAKAEKHSDVTLQKSGIDLEFIWDPYLNTTELYHELTVWKDPSSAINSGQSKGNSTTGILLIGGGLWHARYIVLSPLDQFKASIDSIIALLENQIPSHGLDLATSAVARPPAENDYLYLAPVQVPFYEVLAPDRASTLSADKIDLMNQHLQQLSDYQGLRVLWSYSQMTWLQSSAYGKDGLHVVEEVASQKADVLLNLRCNDVLTTYGHYPFDKTCCTGYGYPLWIQWVMLVIVLGIFPLLFLFVKSGKFLFLLVLSLTNPGRQQIRTSPTLTQDMSSAPCTGIGDLLLLLGRSYSAFQQGSEEVLCARVQRPLHECSGSRSPISPSVGSSSTFIKWNVSSPGIGPAVYVKRPDRRVERLDAVLDLDLPLYRGFQGALDL